MTDGALLVEVEFPSTTLSSVSGGAAWDRGWGGAGGGSMAEAAHGSSTPVH